MEKVKICHLITGLGTGGAETMLYKLLSGINRELFDVEVVSLTSEGVVGKKIKNLGINVYAAQLTKNPLSLYKLLKLIFFLRKQKSDILQTWMYHANFVGIFAKLFSRNTTLIWNIRQGEMSPTRTHKLTLLIDKLCAMLSSFLPKKIIYCAKSSAAIHCKRGYSNTKTVVIPNGFDLTVFKPNPDASLDFLKELGITNKDAMLIGAIARYHPDKDYPTFIKAASIIIKKSSNVYFVCCGKKVNWNNLALKSLIEKFGCKEHFFLLDERQDISRILPAFDILVSSSITEGFSNVIGEAMACNVPCVVTDVGDSAEIVNNQDLVVSPNDEFSLARVIEKILTMECGHFKKISGSMRKSIAERYSLSDIVKQYEDLYLKVLQ